MQKSLKVLSFNIHKGFSLGNFNFVLNQIRDAIRFVHADIVFLQEVIGYHVEYQRKVKDWPSASQFEFLADTVWTHYAYGKNSVYTFGHHGNAILSKYPILEWENINVSTNRFESRGILHAIVEFPEISRLHLLCLHFDLFETGRQKQLEHLASRIREHIPDGDAVIVAGDFNDWRRNASGILSDKLELTEVFKFLKGSYARTFPSWYPVLHLDRIYFRGLRVEKAEIHRDGIWSSLSDHVALSAEFDLADLL